jgi:hypothetical protein
MGRASRQEGAYRVLMGRPRGKKPLRRSRYRWRNIIKIDLYKEV